MRSFVSSLGAGSLALTLAMTPAGAASVAPGQDDSLATAELMQALSQPYPSEFTAEESVALTVLGDGYQGGLLGEFVTTVLIPSRQLGGEGSLTLEYAEGSERMSLSLRTLYRVVGDMFYLNLASFSASGDGLDGLNSEIAPYLSTWYGEQIPQEVLDEAWSVLETENGLEEIWNEVKDSIRQMALDSGASEEDRAQLEEIFTTIEQTDFIQVDKLFRPEGSTGQRYQVTLRMMALVEIMDSVMGDDEDYQAERAEMVRQLQSMNMSMRMFVPDATGQVESMRMVGVYRNPDYTPGTFNDLEMIILGANATILDPAISEIEAPAEYQSFDSLMSQALFMGEVIFQSYADTVEFY